MDLKQSQYGGRTTGPEGIVNPEIIKTAATFAASLTAPVSAPASAPPLKTSASTSTSTSKPTISPFLFYNQPGYYQPGYNQPGYYQPGYIPSYHKYQNLNADRELQETVTNFYLDETIEWLTHEKSFRSAKKHLKAIKGTNGYDIIRSILKLYIRKTGANWYDLKRDYASVKDYLYRKLH
jgi:hypothetical protein